MGMIAEAANVGRSTLYQHFKSKDEVLVASTEWIWVGLASGELAQIEPVLAHIWEHRDRGRWVLFGETGRRLETALVRALLREQAYEQNSAHLIAVQMSGMIFAVLRSWVNGAVWASPADLGAHLCEAIEALRGVGAQQGAKGRAR